MIPRTFYDLVRLDAAAQLAHLDSEEAAIRLVRRFALPHRRSGDVIFISAANLRRGQKLERARRKEARS